MSERAGNEGNMNDDETRQHDTTPATAATPPTTPAATPASDAATPVATGTGVSSGAGAYGAAAPVPATPGPSRRRLLAGLGTAGLVLALTAGAILLLGGSTTPEALRYIPADSAVVVELRMDLPGDQMQKLGNALSRFPGFADQSTLPAKIDEAFTRLVQGATDGETDYVTDIKPWLNGPLFLAGDAAAMESEDAPRFLVSATTNGAVDCGTTFQGRPTTTETYGGLTLTLAQPGDAPGDVQAACAVDGRFALLGDAASVRKAIDTKAGGTGIDKAEAYTAARRSLQGEQLATFWISGEAVRAAAPSPDPSFAIPGLDALSGAIPDWVIVGLRAEDDAFVLDAVAAPTPPVAGASQLTLPPGHASNLAGLVPSDTLVYVEDQGTGINLRNLLATLRAMPELSEPLAMLDGLAAPEDLVGWIEEAAIAVTADTTDPANPRPQLAVLLAATDAAAAAERATTVTTLLGLLAISGDGITLTTSTIGGVSATTVTITDLNAVVPPGSIPDVGELPDAEITFSIAAKDRVVYFTIGEGAIEKILGLQAGAGLADSEAFRQAGARGLQNSRSTLYVAAGATIDRFEALIAEAAGPEWATDIKPYVDPVGAVGAWTTSDGSGTRFRTVVTLVGP